jgi:polyisoprenoid-binding protein YceI
MKQLLIFFAALFLSYLSPVLAAETLTLDPMHTYVLWRIDHFGFSHPSGKWLAAGTLTLDKTHPGNSKVNVTIKVADMITGIDELNKHLKGKLFFDTDQFPLATFASDKVTVTGKDTAKVKGTLTVHGISKPITLNVKLNQAGINPVTNKMTAGFSATATLKRSDFGITTLLPGLGDEVKLDIEAEAVKE